MLFWGPSGAGCFYVCTEDSSVLLLKRASWVGEGGTWGIPGGALAEGYFDNRSSLIPKFTLYDFHKHARKEVIEELGSYPTGRILERTMYTSDKWQFVTFISNLTKEEKDKWTPTHTFKDREHLEARWFHVDALPQPLHFGVAHTLRCSNFLQEMAKRAGAPSRRISHANHREIQFSLPNL